MNRYTLTDELRNEFKPKIQEFLNKMENLTGEQIEHMSNEDFMISFSDTKLNPYILEQILIEMGYEEIDFDKNGWQMDFWINMRRKDNKTFDSTCERLCISGCGMTFELNLAVDEFL